MLATSELVLFLCFLFDIKQCAIYSVKHTNMIFNEALTYIDITTYFLRCWKLFLSCYARCYRMFVKILYSAILYFWYKIP